MGLKTYLLTCCVAISFIPVQISQAATDKVCYTYDELARIKTADYQNSAKIDYQLDAHGNRISLENSTAGSGTCVTPTGDAGLGEPATVPTSNQAPTAVTDNVTDVPENQTITIPVTANDTDPDNDPLIVTFVSHGNHGSASITPDGTAITYNSGDGRQCTNLSDTLIYTIGDGQGNVAQGQVNISYAHADGYSLQTQPPIATGENIALVIGGLGDQMSEVKDILDNDGPPEATLSLVSMSSPVPAGVIYVSGPPSALLMEVNPNYFIPMNGTVTVTFNYTISASYLNCQTQTLTTHPTQAAAQITVSVLREHDESAGN